MSVTMDGVRAFRDEAVRPVRDAAGQSVYTRRQEILAKRIAARYATVYDALWANWRAELKGKRPYFEMLKAMYVKAVVHLDLHPDIPARYRDENSEEDPPVEPSDEEWSE